MQSNVESLVALKPGETQDLALEFSVEYPGGLAVVKNFCAIRSAAVFYSTTTMSDDAELLRRYAEEKSEAAFAEFVQRHAGLVYASALRRLGGDSHAASDVVQKVFISVARHADKLTRSERLTSWLFRGNPQRGIKSHA